VRTARDNLWLDTAYAPGPVLWGEHEADVAILGGGYTGLGAAYFIKQRFPDKRVIVLESQYIGFGSSGRNSGGVSGVLGHNYRNLKQKHGLEKSAQLQRLMARSFEIVEGLIREHRIACDFEKTGRLLVAETERQKRLLEEEAEASREVGGAAIWLDKAEARSRLGSVEVEAAVRYPNEGIANPVKFLRGMRRVVDSLGVEVYEHSPCTHIEPGPKLSLHTPGGTVRAEAMVLATQAYPNPLNLLHFRVLPFYVYNIATEPLSPRQMDELQLPGRENTFNAKNLYWAVRPTADDRLIFTECDALYFYRIDRDYSHWPKAYESHRRLLEKKFPFLEGIRVTHGWGGRLGITLDFLPSVGCTGRHGNIYYSAGYNGQGLCFGQLAGRMIAALMAEEQSELTANVLVNRRLLGVPSASLTYAASNGYKLAFRFWDRLLERGA
jgi:glycine/D-amino acid oxidase-like deaminating enzyme